MRMIVKRLLPKAQVGRVDQWTPAGPGRSSTVRPTRRACACVGFGWMEQIAMPQLGETVTEGTITAWRKQVGEAIAVDEALFEVSTEKVDTEVPSAVDGYVRAILVEEGDTVPIGTPVAVVTATADEPFDAT